MFVCKSQDDLFIELSECNASAHSADSDQTAPKEQSDLGLHFVLRHLCPNSSQNFSRDLILVIRP